MSVDYDCDRHAWPDTCQDLDGWWDGGWCQACQLREVDRPESERPTWQVRDRLGNEDPVRAKEPR